MSWFNTRKQTQPLADHVAPLSMRSQAEVQARQAQWEAALAIDGIPAFVNERLSASAEGRMPWLSTMSAAEMLLSRSHGIRPVAMVSGTCWMHYGFSWTRGHAQGWHSAIERMKMEALAAGANAIVDVKMRTVQGAVLADSMDYTVLGTAVRIDSLPPSRDPVIATVPALEFVRLLEAGIVPTGIAIGAHYEWMTSIGNRVTTGSMPWANQPLVELGQFWQNVRREAVRQLNQDARRLGNGVLTHTHFGQIFHFEEKEIVRFMARSIVIGTTVDSQRGAGFKPDIRMVVEMRDGPSGLRNPRAHGHNAYPVTEAEGAI
jgi:uncharacterized protein YbjQ (UPF0145 family)